MYKSVSVCVRVSFMLDASSFDQCSCLDATRFWGMGYCCTWFRVPSSTVWVAIHLLCGIFVR